jgi:hypothetical protein
MVLTMSEISSERSPSPLIFLEIVCTSARICCMPERVSRTACSPFWAAANVCPAALALWSALSATRRTESVISAMAALTFMASRASA